MLLFIGLKAHSPPVKSKQRAEHHSVNTATEGWKLECRKLAHGKKHFEVEGFTDGHQSFLSEIRLAFKYEIILLAKKAIFVPPGSN